MHEAAMHSLRPIAMQLMRQACGGRTSARTPRGVKLHWNDAANRLDMMLAGAEAKQPARRAAPAKAHASTSGRKRKASPPTAAADDGDSDGARWQGRADAAGYASDAPAAGDEAEAEAEDANPSAGGHLQRQRRTTARQPGAQAAAAAARMLAARGTPRPGVSKRQGGPRHAGRQRAVSVVEALYPRRFRLAGMSQIGLYMRNIYRAPYAGQQLFAPGQAYRPQSLGQHAVRCHATLCCMLAWCSTHCHITLHVVMWSCRRVSGIRAVCGSRSDCAPAWASGRLSKLCDRHRGSLKRAQRVHVLPLYSVPACHACMRHGAHTQ